MIIGKDNYELLNRSIILSDAQTVQNQQTYHQKQQNGAQFSTNHDHHTQISETETLSVRPLVSGVKSFFVSNYKKTHVTAVGQLYKYPLPSGL